MLSFLPSFIRQPTATLPTENGDHHAEVPPDTCTEVKFHHSTDAQGTVRKRRGAGLLVEF